MKTVLLTIAVVFIIVATVPAQQPPHAFNYQTVVRDANGNPMANRNVSFLIRIHKNYSNGTVEYSEVHDVTTNEFGLVTLQIGNGTASGGYFNSIDWGGSNQYLEIAIDTTGGINYVPMGTARLLSVPYALYAENTKYGDNLGNHTATQSIDLNGNNLTGDGGVLLWDSPYDGFRVYKAGTPALAPVTSGFNNGVEVGAAEGNGVFIGQADQDGIHIYQSGNPPAIWGSSSDNNGIEIETAEGNGLYLGHSYKDGIHIGGTEQTGLFIGSTDDDGVNVRFVGSTVAHFSTDTNGVEIGGAVGNGVYVGRTGKDGLHVTYAGDASDISGSVENNGLEIEGAEGNGLFIGIAGLDGLTVNKAGNYGVNVVDADYHGLLVQNADMSGLYIQNSGEDGVRVYSSGDNGVEISLAGNNGVYVEDAVSNGMKIESTGGDGIHIVEAGNPSTTYSTTAKCGVEIEGAEDAGVYIGNSDHDGIVIKKAGNVQAYSTASSYNNGIEIQYVEGYGTYISHTNKGGYLVAHAGSPSSSFFTTEKCGFVVAGAEGYGFYSGCTDNDGMVIHSAGNPSLHYYNNGIDGIEIAGAEANGMYVGRSDQDGVHIYSAGDDGIQVDNAVWYGFWANGVSSNAFVGSTTNSNDEWGLYTPDKIHALNVTSKSNSTYAKNTGTNSLQPGDIVCIAGGVQQDVLNEEGIPAVNIEKAGKGNSKAVFGVVEYKVVIGEHNKGTDKDGQPVIVRQFEYSDGNVAPGEYLSVIVFGQAEVNIDSKEPLKAGDALVAGDNGNARKVRTTEINGITIAENTGIIGKVLENTTGKGKALVFVNCK